MTFVPEYSHTLTCEGHDASEDGTGRGTPIVSQAMSAKWAKGSSGPAGDEHHNLRVVNGGASVRRLTPTECERLQGFPDGWTQLGDTPDSRRYAALGDAVTVGVGEWLGAQLMAHLAARAAA